MKNSWIMQVLGAGLTLAGIVALYIIARRKFNRRTMTGMEGFKTFEKAWSTTLLERLGSLIAKILIVAGMALIILTFV